MQRDLLFEGVAIKIAVKKLKVLIVQTEMCFRDAILRMEERIRFLKSHISALTLGTRGNPRCTG